MAKKGKKSDPDPNLNKVSSEYRKFLKDNNLTKVKPEIATEWHPTKNGDLKPEEFNTASRKMIWWLCPKGHEY